MTIYLTTIVGVDVDKVAAVGAEDVVADGHVLGGPGIGFEVGRRMGIRSGSFTDPGSDLWNATVNYGDNSRTQSLGLYADISFPARPCRPDRGGGSARRFSGLGGAVPEDD